MGHKPNLKPIMAKLQEWNESNQLLGQWPVELHPLHNEGENVLAHGVVTDNANHLLGRVDIDIPLARWTQRKAVGRPQSTDKHLAVLLNWALHAAEFGGRFGDADSETAYQPWLPGEESKYCEGGKVRTIRNDMAKRFGLDLHKDVVFICDPGLTPDEECAVLFEHPSYQIHGDGRREVFGLGIAWCPRFGAHVLRAQMRLSFEHLDNIIEFSRRTKGGPIILALFPAARKPFRLSGV